MSSFRFPRSDSTGAKAVRARPRPRVVQSLVFVALATAILAPVYAYLGLRLVTESRLPAAFSAMAWLALGIHLVMLPSSLVASRLAPPSRPIDALHWMAYGGMGFLALLLPMVAVRDLSSFGWSLLVDRAAHAGVATSHAVSPAAFDLAVARVGNLVLVVVSLVLSRRGFKVARGIAPVRRVRIPIEGLPAELEGYRIAQISDIHVGPTIRGEYLRAIVAAVNELDADLVAVTGDLVDGSVTRLREHVAGLSELRSRDGAYFVTGNHEYYSGPEAWVLEVARLGLIPLVNEHRVVTRGRSRLLVAGVTDALAGRMVAGHRCDLGAATRGAPPCDARLLLSHQPATAREAAEGGFHLQLSGHTHGGQFFPWHLAVRMVTPYVAGLFRIGSMWLYVSRGTGYWGPPLRLGAPSEITLLELVRATTVS